LDVLFDPKNDVTNPRTGLVTNDGPFTRSMPQNAVNKYGSGSATFPGVPAGDVTTDVGPIQQMFQQPAIDPGMGLTMPPVMTQPPQLQAPQQTTNQRAPEDIIGGLMDIFDFFKSRPNVDAAWPRF